MNNSTISGKFKYICNERRSGIFLFVKIGRERENKKALPII
jgi:hypothetical protein